MERSKSLYRGTKPCHGSVRWQQTSQILFWGGMFFVSNRRSTGGMLVQDFETSMPNHYSQKAAQPQKRSTGCMNPVGRNESKGKNLFYAARSQ
eukprot:5825267-Pleurochrysis_carterae.AAC.1